MVDVHHGCGILCMVSIDYNWRLTVLQQRICVHNNSSTPIDIEMHGKEASDTYIERNKIQQLFTWKLFAGVTRTNLHILAGGDGWKTKWRGLCGDLKWGRSFHLFIKKYKLSIHAISLMPIPENCKSKLVVPSELRPNNNCHPLHKHWSSFAVLY